MIYFSYQSFILLADIASRAYIRYAYIQRLYVRSEIIISWASFRDCVCASRISFGQAREYARHTVEIMEIGQRATHRSVMTVCATAPMAGTTRTGTIGAPTEISNVYKDHTRYHLPFRRHYAGRKCGTAFYGRLLK